MYLIADLIHVIYPFFKRFNPFVSKIISLTKIKKLTEKECINQQKLKLPKNISDLHFDIPDWYKDALNIKDHHFCQKYTTGDYLYCNNFYSYYTFYYSDPCVMFEISRNVTSRCIKDFYIHFTLLNENLDLNCKFKARIHGNYAEIISKKIKKGTFKIDLNDELYGSFYSRDFRNDEIYLCIDTGIKHHGILNIAYTTIDTYRCDSFNFNNTRY